LSRLSITLFGGFHAELDGKPLTGFRMDKNRALLAFLVIESERSHRREALANLLWSEHTETAARNNLRQALYHLRQVLGSEAEGETHLLITPNDVQFNPSSDTWLDTSELNSRISTCLLHHPSGHNLCAGCLHSLQRAVDLYQGEMLAGFTLPRCDQFTDWQIIHQENYHRQTLLALTLLADDCETNLAYDQLITYTQRKIELEPWRESAYQQQMWALAMTGQREQALLRYKTLEVVLRQEMGILPGEEIRRLYEQIRDSDLPGQGCVQNRPFASSGSTDHFLLLSAKPFVGRHSELAQLNCYLRDALACRGRVAFISGEAGSGKTALMNEFACRAMQAHGDLLVAGGTCSTFGGLGDAFQPFREILETMIGIASVPGTETGNSQEIARRMRNARPVLLQTLLEVGPNSTVTLLPAQDLLHRASEKIGSKTTLVSSLEALAAQLGSTQYAATRLDSTIASESSFFMGTDLYDQVVRLLHAISHCYPILILLDNLQWLDNASASLLFHLGSHLSGGRILLLGGYRPEDLVAAQGFRRHPLAAVLNEFQRRFGEAPIELSCSDGRAFVHAYLDSQPNHFDQDFRENLYRHTRGNALYTIELLDAMHARGEVVQDHTGHWIPGSSIDWELLPARLEAVITERLDRLNYANLSLLKVASMQGEVFDAGVLAQVVGASEEEVIASLSGPLSKQHRLVSPLGLIEKAGDRRSRYQFHGLLLQKYLYQSLDDVERKRLQHATVKVLGKVTSKSF
jgi:DNA-binding SARP family transcriptional activator